MGKLWKVVVTCILCVQDKMEGTKDEGGWRYQLLDMVHKNYDDQEWSRHRDQHMSLKDEVVDFKRQGDMIILVDLFIWTFGS
jgi:hypothetical protein